MLPLPIEYLFALGVTSLVAAYFLWVSIAGVFWAAQCPPDRVPCSAEVIAARLFGAGLWLSIVLSGFGALIYYIIKKGKKVKKAYSMR